MSLWQFCFFNISLVFLWIGNCFSLEKKRKVEPNGEIVLEISVEYLKSDCIFVFLQRLSIDDEGESPLFVLAIQ